MSLSICRSWLPVNPILRRSIFPMPTTAIISPFYQTLSYRQLDQLSNRIAAGLQSIGIGRGVRTVLMVKPSIDFFALTFALFKVGAVPILIDPGMGVKNLKVCLAEAEPEAFIGIPKAQIARLVLGWGKGTVRTILTVGRKFFWSGTTLERLIAPFAADHHFETVHPDRDETAAILFTSGSTGVPKGAVYSHGNFSAQVDALRDVYQIQPGEIDLPTFPLFALFAPALGMTSVIPEMDFTRPGSVDPEKIIAAIKRFHVTTMFGSPALIRRVGLYGEERKIQLTDPQTGDFCRSSGSSGGSGTFCEEWCAPVLKYSPPTAQPNRCRSVPLAVRQF